MARLHDIIGMAIELSIAILAGIGAIDVIVTVCKWIFGEPQ